MEEIKNQETSTTETTQTESEQARTEEKAAEKTVSKSQYDKASSEIARLKKLLKAKETDEERIAREREEREARLAELERKDRIHTRTSDLMDQGISKAQAIQIAEAIENGDNIAQSIGSVIEDYKKQLNAYKVASVATPSGATETKEVTYKEFKAMTIDERIKLKNSNPELYEQFRKQR